MRDGLSSATFPFTAEFLVAHPDYDRLHTRWKAITVVSANDWPRIEQELFADFYNAFAFVRTKKGTVVRRWNAPTWEMLRTELEVERR